MLTNPKATWHYDIVRGKKHKPSPVKATIAVTAIHTAKGGADTEAYLAAAYKEHYAPRAYLQPRPAVAKKLRWSFLRFGDEDREYHVTGSIAKPNPHTWRTTWKGYYTVPENGEKDPLTWMTEYAPAIGFTQICTEADFCFRLATD